jgi:hypothetical protein
MSALVGAINVWKSLAVGLRLSELRITREKLPVFCKSQETMNPSWLMQVV